MAITFENLVIDRPLYAIFKNSDNEILGSLNQIQNLSITTSSESKDKLDATGVLVKRFFTSKSVEISAENAIFSLSLMGLQTGNGKDVATNASKITVPMIKKYAKTASPVTLPAVPKDGTVMVCGLTADGLCDTSLQYTQDTSAAAGKFSVATANNVATLTLPTDATDYVQVMFEYESATATKVLQSADKFPAECEMIMSVLVSDACDKETVRQAYVVFPSFQMSPDFDLTLDTDSAHPFSGAAAVDYCSADKSLFYIAISEEDEEE